MRSVEYIIISDQIHEISKFYRSIGFISHGGDPLEPVDVTQGADLIASSDMVAFEDRRRFAEGIMLDGLQNFHIFGMMSGDAGSFGSHGIDDEFQYRLSYAFFYGQLLEKELIDNRFIQLNIMVDDVVVGFPEHISEGEIVELRYYLTTEAEREAIENMEIGQQYFLRGGYFYRYIWEREHGIYMLEMRPVNEVTYNPLEKSGLWYRHLEGDAIWYIPVNDNAKPEFSDAYLEQLVEDEIMRVRHSQSSFQLITTTDMTAMPSMDSRYGIQRIVDGRAIDFDDYLAGNSVVVINEHLASTRGVRVGDILTLGIPPNQRAFFYVPNMFPHFTMISQNAREYTYVLELEVVGLWSFGEPFYFRGSMASHIMHIPDSILPLCFSPLPSEFRGGLRSQVDGDTLPSGTYSFVLESTRDEEAFLLTYREKLAELGFGLDFIPTGARNFWDSAEPILQSITFNLVLFCFVLILLLALVSFLYFRQRRRDIAISRVLGHSPKQVYMRMFMSVLIYGVPAIIIGGVGGWFLALREATTTMDSLTESVGGSETIASLPIYYFFILSCVVLFLLIAMFTIGAIRLSRHSVLELLQNSTATRQKDKEQARKKVEESADSNMDGSTDSKSTSARMEDFVKLKPLDSRSSSDLFTQFGGDALPTGKKEKFKNKCNYIFSYILRSKIKSGLAFLIALTFILVFSFLQESINNIQLEINRLYEATVVRGEMLPPPVGEVARVARLSKDIPDMLLETPFLQNDLFIAGYDNLIVIPTDTEGNMPYNWDELLEIDRDIGWEVTVAADHVIAFNDIPHFTIAHSREVFDDAVIRTLPDGRFMEDFHIDFADGFDASHFVYTAGEPIPIIMSAERSSQMKPTIEPGTRVYLGVNNERSLWDLGEWHYLPAVIIGTHNRNILFEDFFDAQWLIYATLMPIPALEALKGEEMRYISVNFEINPVWNKQLDEVEEELSDIARQALMRGENLTLQIHDEELRAVVMPLEENLVLLQNLYPAAISLLAVIALVFNMILMLQNAKNAAIMRVLGMTKKDSRIILWSKNLITCFLGLTLGLFIVMVLGWGFGVLSTLGLMGIFFISSALGSALGALLVTNRAPLDLLQVRE
jgi:ABC-type lipoprotein release transport system permease subunit